MAHFKSNQRGGLSVDRDSLHASPEFKRQIAALNKLQENPMTLPKNVEDAVKSFDGWLDFIFAEYSGHESEWQAIRAELLAMDVEIRTLRATISKCAAAAGEIVMPSCSIEFLKQVPDEIDDVCREYESKIAASESELTEALKDARRYRFVREAASSGPRQFAAVEDAAFAAAYGLPHNFDANIDAAIDAMHNSAREVGE